MEGENSSVAQRRIDDAVDGIGVIETGRPIPRSNKPPMKRTGSSLSASGHSHRSIGLQYPGSKVRSNRRISLFRHRLSSGDSSSSHVDGRARIIKCVVPNDEYKSLPCMRGKETSDATKMKPILHPMRFDLPAGSITAILGTSESGKSTLLVKFLAGYMDKNVIYEGDGECMSYL